MTQEGKNNAKALGERLAGRGLASTLWVSPERRVSETAAFVFPSTLAVVDQRLREVGRPWYPSLDELAEAAARFFRGDTVEGWERRDMVISRIEQLEHDIRAPESVAAISHGLLITTWLHHRIGLSDPLSFWSTIGMPDAWDVDFEAPSFDRIG